MINRRGVAAGLIASPFGLRSGIARANLQRVVFGTNWKAQAEHGGYYQAVADGTYARYGLDVTIRQGGPMVNHAQLLAGGAVDFNMGGNMFETFNAAASNVPAVTVAAIFQKDPQVLIAHPDAGVQSLDDLSDKTLLIGRGGQQTFWKWLKAEFNLSDAQVETYTFNSAPFLANPLTKVQQGYLTAEPLAIRDVGGFEPVVLLLADAGYDSYSTTIDVMAATIERDPDMVQRFVDASIEGWYAYLYGDAESAHALIKRDNPEMDDRQLAFSRQKLLDHGIVDSGDALDLGIGAMTAERWYRFFGKAVEWGVYPPMLDIEPAFDVAFVNRGVGLELKRRLLSD